MGLVSVDNKELIKDYLDAVSGQPKTEELLNRYILDPDLKEHIYQAEGAFPRYEILVHQLIADGDLVAARCTFRGVHKGEFAGISPTGRTVSSEFMIIYRIAERMIVEYWIQLDIQDIVTQLTA